MTKVPHVGLGVNLLLQCGLGRFCFAESVVCGARLESRRLVSLKV